jgi:hypothetical protein
MTPHKNNPTIGPATNKSATLAAPNSIMRPEKSEPINTDIADHLRPAARDSAPKSKGGPAQSADQGCRREQPSEILRLLKVEELWARRNVLAGLMNAERLRVYVKRRSDLAAGCAPVDVASRDKLTWPAATVVPMENREPSARAPAV